MAEKRVNRAKIGKIETAATRYKKTFQSCLKGFFRVGVPGFEPGTPCSQSRCANRAALHPELKVRPPSGNGPCKSNTFFGIYQQTPARPPQTSPCPGRNGIRRPVSKRACRWTYGRRSVKKRRFRTETTHTFEQEPNTQPRPLPAVKRHSGNRPEPKNRNGPVPSHSFRGTAKVLPHGKNLRAAE